MNHIVASTKMDTVITVTMPSGTRLPFLCEPYKIPIRLIKPKREGISHWCQYIFQLAQGNGQFIHVYYDDY